MLDTQDYLISSRLFIQLLGVIYFFAFGAFLFQIRGLIGEQGILPIKNYLYRVKSYLGANRFYYTPSVFWINASDTALMTITAAGTLLSLLLLFNIWPPVMLALLMILYLSIIVTGQDFLSFGWEMFLIEVSLNAFLISLTVIPNIFVLISLNLVLFRFHFQGGAVKLQSRDPNWLNLTGVAFHYQSQPIPNTLAWYAHKLPLWFHKFSTALMLGIEIIVPFGIFLGQEIRLAVFACLVGLQLAIWLTGNFSYLNHLTVVLCIILVSDTYLSPIFGTPPESLPTPFGLDILLSIAGSILIFLQLICLWNHFFKPNPRFSRILEAISPYHFVNRYGIFAIMTTKRYEIVIEGSHDGEVWKEYYFYHKPTELNRRPRRISPYQPRIDWQAWFLPFSNYEDETWFKNFILRLLEGSPRVLALLRKNPFPDMPPKFIRALEYDYEFTDWKTRKETGNWWTRRLVGYYMPPLSLKK